MDAAQKLLRTSALVLALSLLMAAPGWAQTLVAPSSVTIGNTGSNGANITSSAAGTTEITYAIATTYSNDTSGSGSWLVVTGGTVTPATLNFGLRNGTTAGISSGAAATVTLTPSSPSTATGLTITVTFNGSSSGGGGGTSNALTASPNPVSFSGSGTQAPSGTITITNISANTLTLSASATSTPGAWLSVSAFSNSQVAPGGIATFTLYADASGLTTGSNYQGTVTVTPSIGTALAIPVTFTAGGGGTGNWTVNPSNVLLNFTTNSGSFPSSGGDGDAPTGRELLHR